MLTPRHPLLAPDRSVAARLPVDGLALVHYRAALPRGSSLGHQTGRVHLLDALDALGRCLGLVDLQFSGQRARERDHAVDGLDRNIRAGRSVRGDHALPKQPKMYHHR